MCRCSIPRKDVILRTSGVPGAIVDPRPDAPPARKPRCGQVYSQLEKHPPIDVRCDRPEGHKGLCGPAKVVGKAKGGES